MPTIVSINRRHSPFSGLAATLLLACLFSLSVSADYTLTVNPHENRGVWDGWGCSLSWWGNGIGRGEFEALHADLFFTTNTVAYAGKNLPGLGLNIIRYNIGGGGVRGDAATAAGEKLSPKMPWDKDIGGYWLNGTNPSPASDSWDWSRDANQRSMLQAACTRGVTWVEFFSNAPMWWMMDSKSSAGGRLQPTSEKDFAHYIATVVWKAQTAWGLKVRTVDPFNEPQARWWKYPMPQEGCTIPKEQQKNILIHLKTELVTMRLNGVQITAADENAMPEAKNGYEYFKTQPVNVGGVRRAVSDLVDKINVHSYSGLKPWRDNKARAALRQSAGSKKLWASEFCDNDSSGMTFACTILEDLNWLRPSAWVCWQPVEPKWNWALVNADFKDGPNAAGRGKPIRVYTKYYVFAHFTRFLRPGYRVIGSSDQNSVVAYDPIGKRLILITLNYTAQKIHYNLGTLAARSTTAEITSTQTAGNERFATTKIPVADGNFTLDASEKTIYSIVIEGVNL